MGHETRLPKTNRILNCPFPYRRNFPYNAKNRYKAAKNPTQKIPTLLKKRAGIFLFPYSFALGNPSRFAITDKPPMYGRNASGTTIEPSSCW